jgi:hypothetical protein
MQTYLVSNGVNVKIGHSKNARQRIRRLEASIYECSGIRFSFDVLLIIEGDYEKDLQQWFVKDRIGGEWFRPSKELKQFICDAIQDEDGGIPRVVEEIRDFWIKQAEQGRIERGQADRAALFD